MLPSRMRLVIDFQDPGVRPEVLDGRLPWISTFHAYLYDAVLRPRSATPYHAIAMKKAMKKGVRLMNRTPLDVLLVV
jgi:hypothetical protein